MMVFAPPLDVGGAAVETVALEAAGVWAEEQPAAIQAKISRAIHAEQSTAREFLDILP
jgi:hypothetical protein